MLSTPSFTAAFSHPASVGGGLLALAALQLPQQGSWPATGLFLLSIGILWWILHSAVLMLRQRWPALLSEFARQPQQDWWPCVLLLPVLAAWLLVADSSQLMQQSSVQALLQVVVVAISASFLLHALLPWPSNGGQLQRGVDLVHRLASVMAAVLLLLTLMAQLHSIDSPAAASAATTGHSRVLTPTSSAIKQPLAMATDCESREDDEGVIPCEAVAPQPQQTATSTAAEFPAPPAPLLAALLDQLSEKLANSALPYDASSWAIALASLLKLLSRVYLAQPHNNAPVSAPTASDTASDTAISATAALNITTEPEPVTPQSDIIATVLSAADHTTLQQLHGLLSQPGALPAEMQQHQQLLQQLLVLAAK